MKALVQAAPEVIRVQEFARRLQISIWTGRAWCYSGKVASCKVGKLLLVPTSEVDRLLAAGTRPALERPVGVREK